MIPLKDSIPTRRAPILTVALIAANVLVFVLEMGAPAQVLETTGAQAVRLNGFDAVTAEYGFVPCELQQECPLGDDVVDFGQVDVRVESVPTILTLFTSMFMHGGWGHLLGNMLFLWVFGNNVEDRVGRVRFLLFYALGGLSASALQYAVDPGSPVPNIGASGAVAAVLGAYLLLHPLAAVISYVPPFFFFPIPAIVFLVIWFGIQVASAGSAQIGAGGGVAYYAHIGGFVFGLATIRLWDLRNQPPARVRF